MFIVAHNGAPAWGGAERAVALLLAGLAGRGHRVLLLCNRAEVAERAGAVGVPAELLRLGGDAVLTDSLRLAGRLRRLRPDAFIVGTFRKLGLAGPGARLAGGARVVARVGLETDTPRNWKYRVALARCVDRVVVNAAHMRSPFLALPGWTAERVVTIHNGVHPPERRGGAGVLRRSLEIPPEARVVGAVARLVSQKRVDRLLRAVALLGPGVHCVLAGEGGRRAELEALADGLGIRERVHFLGFREDVGDVLDALDVLAVTSDVEGMCSAMLEALAAGVPVVSTAVCGADEALDPLPDGRRPGLVVGFDPGEVAAALGEVLAAPGLRSEMSAAARERAGERFSFGTMLDRWEEVLGVGDAPATGRP
ncbi:MAG TPA: glycosyltransferase [Longimicrobiaceae bacterium]|nr:glycosyltransferase [Longimicrobiaceae bacterium]